MTYVQPVIPLVILLFTLALNRRFARYRRMLTVSALLLLFLWSWPPFVILTSATLEHWYPASDVPTGNAEVIVVLGGSIDDPFPSQPQALSGESTYRRALHAAWLHQHWKPLPILASGGPMGKSRIVSAEVMKRLLVGQGVPEELIWTEQRSLSTSQNARFSTELLRSKGISRIALVTEGYHILRAEMCFRKQGLSVVPAPCFLRSAQPISTWKDLLPKADAILENEASLHEWVGLAWYWLRGDI